MYEKFDEGEIVQHSEGESEFLATKEKHSKITTYGSVHSYGKRINKEKEDQNEAISVRLDNIDSAGVV